MTTMIYDYDAELKRKWAKESEKERLISNIQSLIAARIEEHPEEFDSGDDPISRLSRRIRAAELENERRIADINNPYSRQRELALEKRYKALMDLPAMILDANSL